MSEVENAAPDTGADTFTTDERAYFESRGEKEIPQEPKADLPAAEVKSDPDASQEPAKVEAAEDKAKRMVEYGALAEERAKRKAAEEKIREHEIMQARWEERFRAAQPQQQPQKPPSPDEDIFGAVKHQGATLDQALKKIATYESRMQAEEQMRQLGTWASGQEAEFKSTTPDYDDALKYLREHRIGELKAWGQNEMQIGQQMLAEERQLLFQAAQARKNPAEIAYNLAKARGYQKKAAPDPDEAKRLDVIEAGQQASKSLSSVGGKAGGGTEISAMDVLKMPADEFEAWKNKNPAKYRRIMGSAH